MEWAGVHDLVQRARAGDRAAVDRLYAMAQPYLLALAQKLLGPGWPHKSVSDLTQDTWARAWKGLPKFQGADNDADTGALFRAWLARTMKNVRLNQQRYDGAEIHGGGLIHSPVPLGNPGDSAAPAADPPARDATPSETARLDERLDLVRRALHGLPGPDAEIVRLRFFEGLSLDEVGLRVGRDESTVRHHLQRILKRLGGELKDLK